MTSSQSFFSSQGMMPHGQCLLWKADLLWLHVIADSLIAFAYVAIPVILFTFVYKRPSLPFRGLFMLFGVFIVMCGLTHVMAVWTLWDPSYWVSGGIKAITAMVSVVAAVQLIPALPQAMSLRSPDELERTNQALEHEIAERRRAQQALEESEKRFRDILNQASSVIYVKNIEGRYVFVNRQFEDMFQRSSEEIRGKTDDDLLPPSVAEIIRSNDRQVLEEGSPRQFDETVPKGPEPRDFLSVKFPLFDRDGRSYAVCGILTDITDRKRIESDLAWVNQALEHRTRELEETNKELEAFAYSVSHDLRAPLRHMHGFVRLLEKRLGPQADETSRRYIGSIADSARQMGVLIDDLLTFSRSGRAPMHKVMVPLGQMVQELKTDLEQDLRDRRVVWEIHELPDVRGDRAMIRQVFANLLENAVKYTATRSEARIEVGCSRDDEHETVIYVKDNGVGFDMAYSHKLFGVFQRLHPTDEFEGTGIGLANVRRIIARHGGRTWAEGAVDAGATFYVSVPKAHREHTHG